MFETRDANFSSLSSDVEALESSVSALQTATASGLVFKGTVSSATGITSLTNYKVGWTYKASAAFTISGLGTVESGDMIICIADGSTYSASDWTVVQNNVDVMTGATTAAAGSRGLVPSPTTADTDKFLRGDGTWATMTSESTWGSFSDL